MSGRDCNEYDIASAMTVIDAFLNARLPKEQWTHQAHILSGFYLYCNHGEAALAVMKEHIIRFNEAVGTINSDDSGYHETITFFWMLAIKEFSASIATPGFNDESVARLCNSRLMDKNLPLEFYTRPHLFSVQARKTIMQPDIKPLTGIV